MPSRKLSYEKVSVSLQQEGSYCVASLFPRFVIRIKQDRRSELLIAELSLSSWDTELSKVESLKSEGLQFTFGLSDGGIFCSRVVGGSGREVIARVCKLFKKCIKLNQRNILDSDIVITICSRWKTGSVARVIRYIFREFKNRL